ncbi:MAG: hypothetical protein OXF63_00395 [Anaerolineaceae bacterium]|nr:hypothetical protein [Anaerolineaceae bacterium]
MDLPRQTVEDHFHGHVLRLAGVTLLSTLADSAAITLASGPLLLRYGIVCLETPQHCLVPELVVMEYGELLNDEAAWDFLLHHSNLHPRAEVLGRRDDGVEDQLRVSRLDLAQTPRVLVWPRGAAGDATAVARPQAVIADKADSLPERLRRFLPLYPSLADWRHEHI